MLHAQPIFLRIAQNVSKRQVSMTTRRPRYPLTVSVHSAGSNDVLLVGLNLRLTVIYVSRLLR